MTCTHPITRLLKIHALTEYTDRERIFYRECISCPKKITSVEVQLPDGMSATTGINLISQFLAELAKDRYAVGNEGTKPSKEELKVANNHSDAEFRERVCDANQSGK